jgi:membrane protein
MTAFLNELKAKIIAYIWDRDLSQEQFWHRVLFGALRIAYLTVRDIFDGQLNLRAMSLVYTTLLSLVPLLAVSVSVLKGFGAKNYIETTLPTFLEPLGERGKEISDTIIKFVEGINSGILGSLGLALLLYTVVSLMQKIESAFNFTWHVNEERSFARRFSDYLSVILIGPVLVFSALGLTASVANSAIYQAAMSYQLFAMVIGVFELLIPYLLIILAFTVLYIFIPNTKVKFVPALVGASVAGVLWQTVGWLFASYVSTANYTAIYAAFAALFFFMIWLYISWSIMLIGGSIAFYFQNPEFRSLQRRRLSLSNRMKEKAALLAMMRIASDYYNKQKPLTLSELANYLNIASESLSQMMDSLINRGLLIRTDSDPSGYIPGQSPDVLPVIDILVAVRSAGEDDIIKIKRLPHDAVIDQLYSRYQAAATDTVSGIMLKDLVKVVENKQNQQITG